MTVAPHPPYISLLPRLKLKLKGSHFDTFEMIEAETQAVLKALTEHDFQDAFKKWHNRWERCTRAVGDYLECEVGPKLVFDQNGCNSPGNYGWLLLYIGQSLHLI
jgi:hypothetical protein